MILIHEHQLPSLGEHDEATLKEAMAVMEILDHGVRRIDESKLRAAFRQVLLDWYAQQKQQNKDHIAAIHEKERKEAEAAQEKARLEAADARLKQWVVAGMLEDEHNQQALIAFFQRNNTPYNAYNLDVAVKSLTAELHWAIWAKHLQPAEEPQAEEVLGRVRGTNEKQLPLNSTEADLRKASKEQVADWMARKRAADGTEYRAGIGSAQRHGVTF